MRGIVTLLPPMWVHERPARELIRYGDCPEFAGMRLRKGLIYRVEGDYLEVLLLG